VRVDRAAALAVLAMALVSCTSTEAGDEPIEPVPTGAAEASAVAQLARRPAELPVDGVDPCTLFPPPVLKELRISQQPRPGTADGARVCTLSQQHREPMYDLRVAALPDAGVAAWITGRMARPGALTARPFTVAEFPAVLVSPPDDPPGECEVVVGVAQGQSVQVRFSTSYRDEFQHEQACELTAEAAAAAVSALREKKG